MGRLLLGSTLHGHGHTAVNILDQKGRFYVQFFGTDLASNIVKAIADCGFVHVRCMVHSLHLAVSNALNLCQGVSHALTIGHWHSVCASLKQGHCEATISKKSKRGLASL